MKTRITFYDYWYIFYLAIMLLLAVYIISVGSAHCSKEGTLLYSFCATSLLEIFTISLAIYCLKKIVNYNRDLKKEELIEAQYSLKLNQIKNEEDKIIENSIYYALDLIDTFGIDQNSSLVKEKIGNLKIPSNRKKALLSLLNKIEIAS